MSYWAPAQKTTVSNEWWNELGDRTGSNALDNANCDAKAMRLGFLLSADVDEDDVPDNAPAKAAIPPATNPTPATGFCVDTTDTPDLPPNLHEEVDRNDQPMILPTPAIW